MLARRANRLHRYLQRRVPPGSLRARKIRARRREFREALQTDRTFKMGAQKIFRFRIFENHDLTLPFRSDRRGVRVVTNVERNAVDGNVPIDVRHIRGRRSRVVPARPCRRYVVAGILQKRRENDGGKQATVHREEHEVSRKTTAQGRPECLRLYLWFTRSRKSSLRGSPGCSGHPAFPAPSVLDGRCYGLPQAQLCRGNAETRLACS